MTRPTASSGSDELLARAVEPLRPEGRPLYAGLRSQPTAGLDARRRCGAWPTCCASTAATPHRRLRSPPASTPPRSACSASCGGGWPMRSYSRTRAWTDAQFDAATERLQSRGVLEPTARSPTHGRDVREEIEQVDRPPDGRARSPRSATTPTSCSPCSSRGARRSARSSATSSGRTTCRAGRPLTGGASSADAGGVAFCGDGARSLAGADRRCADPSSSPRSPGGTTPVTPRPTASATSSSRGTRRRSPRSTRRSSPTSPPCDRTCASTPTAGATIVWPTVGLWSASTPGGDVILVLGPEPALRWKLFVEQIVGVAGGDGRVDAAHARRAARRRARTPATCG